MRRSEGFRVVLAVLVAGLLAVVMATLISAQSGILLARSPVPPVSLVGGMAETFAWTVTTDGSTPDLVEFRVLDPDGLVVDSHTYPGSSGLSVTRTYTVPSSPAPKAGRYLGEVTYYSLEGGEEAYARASFYVAERGNLSVFKFDDFNGNGVQDPGDGPVEDVIIRLLTPFGDTVGQPTGADGFARWEGVAVGEYEVSEIVPGDREPTLPISYTASVTVGATTYITFANRLPPSHISGHLWHDANRDGVIDPGEADLPDITVTLYGDDNGNGQVDPGESAIDATNSDGLGDYDFPMVRAGDYVVVVDASDPDLPPAVAPVGTGTTAVTGLLPDETRTVNFGFDDTGTVSGRVWDDADGGGLIEPSEDPLPGIQVCLYQDNNGNAQVDGGDTLLGCRDSQIAGDYSFDGLPGAIYVVDVDQSDPDLPPGSLPTTPDPVGVILNPGGQIAVNFGFRAPASPTPTATETPTSTPTPTPTATPSCPTDGYEPDDMPAQASWISLDGTSQSHALEPPTDLDWVTFNAVAQAVYTFRTDNLLGNTDTILTLYDTDGVTALANNDDIVPVADLRSRIIWQAPASGQYFVRVRDYYQSSTLGCLGYDLIATVDFGVYLPLIVVAPQAEATPTPTATLTPTQTGTPTITPTPTATATPSPTPLPTLVIPELRHPKEIGVALETHRLYIASRDTDAVYEVDPLTASVIRSIPVGDEPFGVGINNLTSKAYVANFMSDDLSIIDITTGVVSKTISFAPFGEPTYVGVDETANRIYVPLHQDGQLAIIDGAADTVIKTVDVGAGAFGLAVDPLKQRVYVSCRDANLIRVLDSSTDAILWDQTIFPVGMPYSLGIDPGIERLYASFAPDPKGAGGPKQMLVYRTPSTGPVLQTAIIVGNGGEDGGVGIAANPTTHHVFVTNTAEDSVSVVDGLSNLVLTNVTVGHAPLGVTVDPGLGYVFVGNRDSNSISGFPDAF